MLSVRTYLILMNMVILVFLFPTISGYYWNKISDIRDSRLEDTLAMFQSSMEGRGAALIQGMSLSIHEAVAGFDFSFVNTLLHQVVKQDQELHQCLVLDAQGSVFAHNNAEKIGSLLNQPVDVETKALFGNYFPTSFKQDSVIPVKFLSQQNQMFYVASPIYRGKALWGVLRCAYLTQSLEAKIKTAKSHWQSELVSMRNSFFGIAAFFFALAVLFTLLFTTKFVSAIQNLTAGVKRIDEGDLQYEIGMKGLLVKELQSFATAFNSMTQNLYNSHKKLDEHNQILEETVKLRTKELEATNKELEAFSYSVSHDLKAPLRAINGFNHVLMEEFSDDFSEEGKAYLEKVHAATIKMQDLISGMLTLSRIGRDEIVKEDVNVTKIIESIMLDILEAGPDKANNVSIQADLKVVADRKLVNIVFENLLSNAWKYSSKKDKIEISIGVLSDNPDVFFIKNNGAGFNMDHASKLFSPFQRLHKSEDFDGTGVGLATVSNIINRHSGSIWFDSHVGEGTTFYFSFTPVNMPAH